MKKLSVILAVLVILTLGLVGCSKDFGTGKYVCYKVKVDGVEYTEIDQSVEESEFVGVAYVEVGDEDVTVTFVNPILGTWVYANNVLSITTIGAGSGDTIQFTYEPTGDLIFNRPDGARFYFKR